MLMNTELRLPVDRIKKWCRTGRSWSKDGRWSKEGWDKGIYCRRPVHPKHGESICDVCIAKRLDE